MKFLPKFFKLFEPFYEKGVSLFMKAKRKGQERMKNTVTTILFGLTHLEALAAAEYDLVIINDENTPLAAGVQNSQNNFYLITLLVLACCFVIAIAVTYFTWCQKYRLRLRELQTENGKAGYRGWNLKRLMDEQQAVEAKIVSKEFI